MLLYKLYNNPGVTFTRNDIIARKEDILQWIKDEKPKYYICQQLGCKPETLNSYLKKMGIEYAGQRNKKGQHKGQNVYKNSNYYTDHNVYIASSKLRDKLLRDGRKDEQCELCGLSMWLGEKIPLELHHKNNNRFDNNFDNLQILCPNCHAVQPNNSGANIGEYNIYGVVAQSAGGK